MGRFSVDSELLSPDDFLLPSQTERRWILIWKGGAVTGYYIFLFLNQTQLFQTCTWKSWMICVSKKGLVSVIWMHHAWDSLRRLHSPRIARSGQRCPVHTSLAAAWELASVALGIFGATKHTEPVCKEHLDQAKLACVTNWWISGNFKFGKYQQSISFGWRRVGLHLVAMMLSSGHPITLLDHANGTKEPKHRV